MNISLYMIITGKSSYRLHKLINDKGFTKSYLAKCIFLYLHIYIYIYIYIFMNISLYMIITGKSSYRLHLPILPSKKSSQSLISDMS